MLHAIRFYGLLITVLTLLGGCTSGKSNQPIDSSAKPLPAKAPAALTHSTASGFLGDYSGLKPSTLHSTALVERSDKLASYTKFLIDTPKVLPVQTVRGVPIDAATAVLLAGDLKDEAREQLSINFTVTEFPGAGVARIRSAITQLAMCVRQPGSPNLKIGGASVEMEIVDSLTGERLAAVVESDAVTSTDPQLRSKDPFYDSKLVFRHWSARLAKWLLDTQR